MSNNTSLFGQSTTTGQVESKNFTTLYSGAANAIPVTVVGNTTYEIAAGSTTGGSNLNLIGSDASIDTVKFASGGGTTVTWTDDNTITISSTGSGGATSLADLTDVTLTSPTVGNLFYYNGTDWVNSDVIATSIAANRPVFQYDNSTAGVSSGIFSRKNFGATSYTTGDGTAYSFQLDSDSQATNQLATISAAWNASAPIISLSTNINNNTAGPFITAASFSTALATLKGDLTVQGGTVTLNGSTSGTVALNAPAIAGTQNYTLPTSYPGTSGYALVSTTGGTMSWAAIPGSGGPGTFGNITVAVVDDNTISTTTGDLKLDSATNLVAVNAGLNVDSGVLYVDATNNRVGINNTSPSYELQVGDATDGLVQFGLTNTERTALFTSNASDDLFSFNYSGGNRLQFDLANQWFNSGRLGVATATPLYTLHVNGEAYVNSNLTVHGTTILGNDYVTDATTVTGEFSVINNSVTNLFVDNTSGYVGIMNTGPAEALDVTGNANVSGNITCSQIAVDNLSTYNSQTTTTTATTTVAISSTTRASQKSVIKITDNVTGEMHMLEALAFHKGATAYLTTYAEMYTSAALATFTASYSGGAINILATPASTNSTTFTVARISLD